MFVLLTVFFRKANTKRIDICRTIITFCPVHVLIFFIVGSTKSLSTLKSVSMCRTTDPVPARTTISYNTRAGGVFARTKCFSSHVPSPSTRAQRTNGVQQRRRRESNRGTRPRSPRATERIIHNQRSSCLSRRSVFYWRARFISPAARRINQFSVLSAYKRRLSPLQLEIAASLSLSALCHDSQNVDNNLRTVVRVANAVCSCRTTSVMTCTSWILHRLSSSARVNVEQKILHTLHDRNRVYIFEIFLRHTYRRISSVICMSTVPTTTKKSYLNFSNFSRRTQ